jgi:flagellum-specific peptidoglycan hydrolase FlgJ
MANSGEISTDTICIISRPHIVSELAKIDSLSGVALSDSMALSVIKEFDIQHPYIVLAQMKIESGNYQSNLANSNNNYFGMRHPTQRLTVSLGNKNGYARYRNWAYSILDYALWQRRYAWNLTEKEYLTKLSNTYAEDPNYITKVKNIAKNLENEK